MHWADSEHWDSCIFEIDSVDIFNFLSRASGNFLRDSSWISECGMKVAENHNWRVSLVRREANILADVMAKKAVLDC